MTNISELIDQLPGYVNISDQNSRLLMVNNAFAKLVGFRSKHSVDGSPYEELPSAVSESAEIFCAQDKLVRERKTNINILSFHPYHDKWKLVFAEKKPFYLDSKLVGTICCFMDVTNFQLIDLARFLTTGDKKIPLQLQQFSFTLTENNLDDDLPAPLAECLFYLLRGKAIKDIALVMCKSPRTVEEYIEKLRSIFECNTKSQLVEKTTQLGYQYKISWQLIKSAMRPHTR